MGWELVLPDWMGPAELAVAEKITGGRVVEIPNAGRVLISRADGEGGWIDMGYVDHAEIEQADEFKREYDGMLDKALRVHKRAMEFEAPFELMEDWARTYSWATSLPADWFERWSRHMLNGPAALMMREGWRSGPVRWSESAMLVLADLYPTRQLKHRVMWNWASRPEIQGRQPDRLGELLARKQRYWAERWGQVFDFAYGTVHTLPPEPGYTDPAQGEVLTVDRMNQALDRIWEGKIADGGE